MGQSSLVIRTRAVGFSLLLIAMAAAVVLVSSTGCRREPDLAQLSPDLAALAKGSTNQEVLAKTRQEVETEPSAESYERLAQGYVLTGQTAEAIKALEKALELDPDYPRAVLGMAVIELRQGKFAEAEETARRLLDDSYRGPREAQTVVARSMLGRKEYQQAADVAAMGIKHHSRYAPLHYVLGDAYMSLKALPKATAAYQTAVKLQPRERMYRQALIIALLMDNNVDQAMKEARAAQKILPDSPHVQFLAGTVYSAADDTDAAIVAYEEALILDPDMGPATNNLAQTLADRGEQLTRAEELAVKAVRQEPDNHAYADTLAWVWVRSGKYEKGIRMLEAVREKWPTGPAPKYHLGYALVKSGDTERGKALLSEAAQADDRPDVAKLAREALERL